MSPFPMRVSVVYSDVSCGGMESTIQECNKNLHGTFECSNSNLAGVMCNDGMSHARKIARLKHNMILHSLF